MVCENCQKLANDVERWESKYKDLNEQKDTLWEIRNDYFELCKALHELMDDLPENVKTKLWDRVYSRFEP